jgi:hypothetical protein
LCVVVVDAPATLPEEVRASPGEGEIRATGAPISSVGAGKPLPASLPLPSPSPL